MTNFKKETEERIQKNSTNKDLKNAAQNFMHFSTIPKYSYNFEWLGRPIIQYPQDMIAVQEIIWNVNPDLIIETGIAHGGSLIFSASLLALLDLCQKNDLDNSKSKMAKRMVLGIDIDIREHNKIEIEKHPLSSYIKMIQGSSIDSEIINQVKEYSKNFKKILIFLDSNHTHEHVIKELEAYANLTSLNSYCVVFDTLIEDMDTDMYPDRSWGPGNNPKTAVREYLQNNDKFILDETIQNKILITVAPDGYLKRIKI